MSRMDEATLAGIEAAYRTYIGEDKGSTPRAWQAANHVVEYGIRLVYEVRRLRDALNEQQRLNDAARLLGPARMVLDRAAEGVASREECADLAQRIVDLIGHPVTDEPPHALVRLAAAEAALTNIREARNCLGAGPMDYEAFVDEVDRALGVEASECCEAPNICGAQCQDPKQ